MRAAAGLFKIDAACIFFKGMMHDMTTTEELLTGLIVFAIFALLAFLFRMKDKK